MTHPTQADGRRFARMNLKGLTPAQLFDSLVAATGYRENPQVRANAFASRTVPAPPSAATPANFPGCF